MIKCIYNGLKVGHNPVKKKRKNSFPKNGIDIKKKLIVDFRSLP